MICDWCLRRSGNPGSKSIEGWIMVISRPASFTAGEGCTWVLCSQNYCVGFIQYPTLPEGWIMVINRPVSFPPPAGGGWRRMQHTHYSLSSTQFYTSETLRKMQWLYTTICIQLYAHRIIVSVLYSIQTMVHVLTTSCGGPA